MNEFLIVLFILVVVVAPVFVLLFLGNRNADKNLPMDDLATIRFIKQQEMIEGMKHGNKD
jgi:hypothetical protein